MKEELTKTNIVLVGLGPHAKRIYIKFLKNLNIKPKLIIDLIHKENEIKAYLSEIGFGDVECYFIDDSQKDDLELSGANQKDLQQLITDLEITHAIISTEPKAHFSFAKFFLNQGVNVLMDKPITAPKNVITNAIQVEKIENEYLELCQLYKMQKLKNPNIRFDIQCQRRFQKGYTYVKELLTDIINKYNIPITYIDIYHNDGMWNMPNEFFERENHPYKYGYGKLFHSGYHFIDILVWLIECNNQLVDKKINKCSIYAESLRPKDFFNYFNNTDYNNILHTNKFEKWLAKPCDEFGEIDIHSIINFYQNNNLITNCSLNLMQSGFSRRSWVELPADTYKGNGRVRHERVNICVGPLINIQIHSYQAYEIKDKPNHNSANVGDVEHFDIYIFRNTDLIGGVPFEKIELSNLITENEKLIGHNENAREKCLLKFLNNEQSDADLLLHNQSITLTKQIYKSLLFEGEKLMFDINLNNVSTLTNIGNITDSDVGFEPVETDGDPIIRYGARGIVTDDNNNIAVFNKKLKNEWKLPGGGIDDGETPEQAFVRECKEELGCDVEVDACLGYITETKTQGNFKQISFVFKAHKIRDLKSNNLTQKEIEEGSVCTWISKTDALKNMQLCLDNIVASKYDSVYRTKFMVLRDIKIVEYYINN